MKKEKVIPMVTFSFISLNRKHALDFAKNSGTEFV